MVWGDCERKRLISEVTESMKHGIWDFTCPKFRLLQNAVFVFLQPVTLNRLIEVRDSGINTHTMYEPLKKHESALKYFYIHPL